MGIRVISGSAKGRKLKLVPGDGTRPIMDRVKEALFSIIGHNIVDARFLDLYAGTGSVGIEALSRGAEHVVFVELARAALKTIYANLVITDLAECATVRRIDVLELLRQSAPPEPFDYIYVAPPQYKNLWLKTLEQLDANPTWFDDNTTIIVQIDPSEKVETGFQHIKPYDERRYGKTLLWFFETSVIEE